MPPDKRARPGLWKKDPLSPRRTREPKKGSLVATGSKSSSRGGGFGEWRLPNGTPD